jgi:DNA-damage-inducible protein J
MKSAIINARVKPDLKEDAEAILAQLGITATQAITMFYEQIRINNGIPFELKLPSAKRIDAGSNMDGSHHSKPRDIGELATSYFGPENGVELELPKREIVEPVSFD